MAIKADREGVEAIKIPTLFITRLLMVLKK
jgi:hypothetical protein